MHAPTVTPATDGTAVRPRAASDALPRAVLAGFAASLIMLLMFLVAYNLARLLAVSPTLTAQPIEPLRSWFDNLAHNRLIAMHLEKELRSAKVVRQL